MERPRLKLLEPLQRRALDLFFSEEAFSKVFYLTGGTALSAFYLGHRSSDDLDFFTNASDIRFLLPMLQGLERKGKLTIDTRTPQFIRTRFGGTLKTDFVQDVPFRTGVPWVYRGWRIDSLENIALNKVTAIQGRLDVKDYVDLYFLLKEQPEQIFAWLNQAQQKDSSVDPFLWSRIIADVETFRLLPRMIRPLDVGALRDFYQKLRQRILQRLKPV